MAGATNASDWPAFRFLLEIAENQENSGAKKVGHKPEKTREINARFLCPT
jgi:hypothetical protein